MSARKVGEKSAPIERGEYAGGLPTRHMVVVVADDERERILDTRRMPHMEGDDVTRPM